MSIIIGYQGIGKSTLVKNLGIKTIMDDGYPCIIPFIDFESSNFKDEYGKRQHDWYKIYINIAVDLHSQGYNVFTSSHALIREYLHEILTNEKYENIRKSMDFSTSDVMVCYPSLDLKEQWIDKLRVRAEQTNLAKDAAALANAEEMYDEGIMQLMEEVKKNNYKSCELKNMDYDLFTELLVALEFKF